MQNNLLKVALRQKAIFIPKDKLVELKKGLTENNTILISNLRNLGYTVSEDLLQGLNSTIPSFQLEIFNTLKEQLGVDLNWAPLVKGWDTPTGESRIDHIITFFANLFKSYLRPRTKEILFGK